MTKLYTLKTGLSKDDLRQNWQRIVRGLAGHRYRKDPGAIQIDTEANGKPFVAGHPDFHFSVSHTGDLLVIAVSDSPVGVDVELVRPIKLKLADRFFTGNERSFVLSELDGREQRFFTVWTRKEAWLKYSGIGIRIPLSSFDVMNESLAEHIDTVERDGYLISCCHAGSGKIEFIQFDPTTYQAR